MPKHLNVLILQMRGKSKYTNMLLLVNLPTQADFLNKKCEGILKIMTIKTLAQINTSKVLGQLKSFNRQLPKIT